MRSELEGTRGELLALREALEKATSDREQYRALYMQLLERCRLLERGIVAGKKADRSLLERDIVRISRLVLDSACVYVSRKSLVFFSGT